MKKCLKFFFTLAIIFFLWPNASKAQVEIHITHEAGFEGQVKTGRSYPLFVTVTNGGTEPFSGDLLIHFSGEFTGARVMSIYLDGGESRRYTTILPASSEADYFSPQLDESFVLYEGAWQKGKKIAFSGNSQMNFTLISQETVTVGILSKEPDRVARLKRISEENYRWHYLQEDVLPEDARGLEYFDYMIIDEYPLAALSQEQQEALLTWVQAGGTLIVGATENARQKYGILFNELPLQEQDRETLESVSLGEELTVTNLPVWTGAIHDGEMIEESEGRPLVVKKELGSGQIIQMAFSIGSEPIISQEGFPEWFASFIPFKKRIIRYPVENLYNTLYWDFGRYNEYFPGPKVTHIQLTGILVLYLVLLVPVLYWILKRLDHREHAWWLIPVISLICSGLIFFVGAKDRLARAKMNEMGIFVSENGRLQGFHILSFQSNRGGEYVVQTKESEYLPVPIGTQSSFLNEKSKLAIIEDERDHLVIVYPDMEYWSIRSLIGEAAKTVNGSFSAELSLSNRKLTGTITNEFPYDFSQVFIWSGINQYELGPLAQGDSIEVEIDIEGMFLRSPLIKDVYLEIQGNENRQEIVQKALLSGNIHQLAFNHSHPVIAGITTDEIIATELVGEDAERQRASLILVPFQPQIAHDGDIVLDHDELQKDFRSLSSTKYEMYFTHTGEFEIFAEPGEYEFIFQLPAGLDRERLTVSKINIALRSLAQHSIWNAKEKTFVGITPQDGQRMEIMKEADDYVTENGEIIIRVTIQSRNDPTLFYPMIQLEGSVARDD